MAWEGGNADTSWMFENIDTTNTGGGGGGFSLGNILGNFFGGGAQQQPQQAQPAGAKVWGLTPEDWRNIQYMTGAMGQAALKGTSDQWLGDMAGVSAQMAKNAQVSAQNKDYQSILQNITNPHVKEVTVTEKPDGSKTIKLGGETTGALQQALMQDTSKEPISSAIKSGLGPALGRGPSFFDPARRAWWLQSGQQM